MMPEQKRTTLMCATAIATHALDTEGGKPMHHREMPWQQGNAGPRTGAASAYLHHYGQG